MFAPLYLARPHNACQMKLINSLGFSESVLLSQFQTLARHAMDGWLQQLAFLLQDGMYNYIMPNESSLILSQFYIGTAQKSVIKVRKNLTYTLKQKEKFQKIFSKVSQKCPKKRKTNKRDNAKNYDNTLNLQIAKKKYRV